MKKDRDLAIRQWNLEYRTGKYIDEDPIPFVDEILATLIANNQLRSKGLYVGCGNGRNYIPLIDVGLRLTGIDISPEALRQIESKRPDNPNELVCADFLDYQPPGRFEYLVSIQVFQHGSQEEVAMYFEKTAQILKPGGLFFLRVNSTATQIYYKHEVTETDSDGGKTVEYIEGPKAGMSIHFYSKKELERLTAGILDPVNTLEEVIMARSPAQSGQWAQWEGVWRRPAKGI